MATYSRQEFIRQVLVEMGVLDATEAPEAEDAVFVGDRADQKFEELYEDGLLPFDIDGEIPGRYFLPLVSILAIECAPSYGMTERLPILAPKAADGMKRLWKLRQKPVADIPARATYY